MKTLCHKSEDVNVNKRNANVNKRKESVLKFKTPDKVGTKNITGSSAVDTFHLAYDTGWL